MKMFWRGGLVVGGIVVLLLFARWQSAPRIADAPTRADRSVPSSPETLASSSSIHPVSLQALFESRPDGRDLRVGEVLENHREYTRYAITYRSGALNISGIMNVPKGTGPFPVLILNHGYIDPRVYTTGRGLKREQDYFARHEYVVLHPDYRNHGASDDDPNTDLSFRLGYAEDAANAVRAVQASELPFLDRERVGMLGHSMGGGVTLNVLVAQPGLVDAAVLYASVSADARENFRRWIERRPALAVEIVARYGSPEAAPAFWENVSPRTFLDRVSVPVLIHHGTSDASVPLEWSQRLAQDLRAKGKDVTLHLYEGEAHEFGPQWTQFMERTVAFFDARLKSREGS